MGGHNRNAAIEQAEQEGGRVGATGEGYQHPGPVEKTGAGEALHEGGGGGWVRTTDNTIMSRVLYH